MTDRDHGRPCPACGTGMQRHHCKYVCPRHGVVYSNFRPSASGLDPEGEGRKLARVRFVSGGAK